MIKTKESLCYLEPITHTYIHRVTGKKYKSVTTAIGLIEPHFDVDAVSMAIVRQSDKVKNEQYIGMNKAQILDYWQMLNDTANEYGTYVHNTIEKWLLANKWYFPDDDLGKKVITGLASLKIDEGILMQPERILFSEEYEIAGMSDLIIDITEEFFDVGDWKTNKKFNYFNPFGFQTLLKPFEYWQNTQYSIYTLQLSIYAYLYEKETGKKCRQIWIGYWDKEIESFTKIPILYAKLEAKKLLELHKYNTLMSV